MKTKVETPYVEVLSKKYCAWCLKPMKLDSGYEDSYYYWETNYCDCEKAEEYVKLLNDVEMAEKKLTEHERSNYQNVCLKNLSNSEKNKFAIWEAKTKVELISKEIKLLEEIKDK